MKELLTSTNQYAEKNEALLHNYFVEWIKGYKGERTARIQDPRLIRVLSAFTSQNANGLGELNGLMWPSIFPEPEACWMFLMSR